MRFRPTFRLAAGILAAAVAFVAAILSTWHDRKEQSQQVLDPARVVLLRTPGGLLEVGSLEKAEEFGWKTSWDCGPVADCGKLFGTTVSRVRVRARYTYRIPLADEWRLERDGAQWRLQVPQVQLATPVPCHTGDVEINTTSGWLSPPAGPNRDLLLRNIGPELARRGADPAYLQAQQPLAEKTVAEFARRWMLEQRKGSDLPIHVTFSGPPPA
ncbi:MAG TPA: hypothetical protein VGF26_26980 [Ramlibacter sp.]